MPLEAGTEVRAQEGRPRSVQEARGKVIAAGASAPAEHISVIVTADGIRIDGSEPLDEAALEAKLRAHVARDAAVRVKIGIAASLPATREAELRAVAKRAGVKTLEVHKSIDTQVAPYAPPKPDTSPMLVVSIPADGKFIVGARVIPDDQLESELKKLYANGMRRLAIQPDGKTTVGRIRMLEAAAKAAGFKDISYVAK